MPNPLDLLRKLGSFATTPLVDEETIAPYQDALDHPTLERSPMEARLRGFGAGAMEGVRSMTDPLSIASFAIPGMHSLMGAARGAEGIAGGVRAAKALAPTMDLIESPAVRQVAPAIDDVESLVGDLRRNLARIPSSRAVAKPTSALEQLGTMAPQPEFVERGGEAAYNAGRTAQTGIQPLDVHQALLQRLGGKGR